MKQACLVADARRSVRVAVAAVVLCTAPQLFAEAYYSTYLNYNQTGGFVSRDSQDTADDHVSYASFSGGPWTGWTLAPGESIAFTSGRADAADLSMGVNGFTKSMPDNNEFTDCRMYTSVGNTFTVRPGTSGLAEGATTRMRMQLRMDGTLYAESLSHPNAGWAHSEINADFEIYDPLIRIDTGEGYITPRQVTFGADAEVEAYHVNRNYYDHSGYTIWEEYWSASTNVQDPIGNDDWFEQESNLDGGLVSVTHLFDTGTLSLEFDAIVGHTLYIDSSIYCYVNSNQGGASQADFYNTLAFDVAPVVEGVQLDWAVVPEPSSLCLIGLAGLALRRCRRS